MDDEEDGQDRGRRRPPWEDWPRLTGAELGDDGNAFDALSAEDTSEPSDAEPTESGWVSAGGVLEWAGPEEEGPAIEAASPLAEEDISMPEGAPPGPRLRAVHAWLARRRAHALDALGDLLLAQREQRAHAGQEPPTRRRRRGEPEASPLDLALAEHQTSADEYEALLSALDDLVAHTGPQRALIEFHLWLAEHLAALATHPDAVNAGRLATTTGQASWLGRAQAALATRTRVEQVTAPATDD